MKCGSLYRFAESQFAAFVVELSDLKQPAILVEETTCLSSNVSPLGSIRLLALEIAGIDVFSSV